MPAGGMAAPVPVAVRVNSAARFCRSSRPRPLSKLNLMVLAPAAPVGETVVVSLPLVALVLVHMMLAPVGSALVSEPMPMTMAAWAGAETATAESARPAAIERETRAFIGWSFVTDLIRPDREQLVYNYRQY